jgi:hypothetical protein
MSPTVDALLPLSFLEAVRAVDRPDDDAEAEFVAELRNKRLGLSDTVYAQIRRYSEARRRRERQAAAEVAGLARLIGPPPRRRGGVPAAGRYSGERAYATLPDDAARGGGASGVLRRGRSRCGSCAAGPALLRRHGAARTGARWCSRCRPRHRRRAPGAAVAYYEAGFAELLGRLTGGDRGRAHRRARAPRADAPRRGPACIWRAEWHS